MTVQVESFDTQVVSALNNEYALSSPTTAGSRILTVDATSLVSGDTLTLRVKEKVLSGGTVGLVKEVTLYGPVYEGIVKGLPFTSPYGCTYTLTQSTGTLRSIPWRIDLI